MKVEVAVGAVRSGPVYPHFALDLPLVGEPCIFSSAAGTRGLHGAVCLQVCMCAWDVQPGTVYVVCRDNLKRDGHVNE
jgi:hypothetical protein